MRETLTPAALWVAIAAACSAPPAPIAAPRAAPPASRAVPAPAAPPAAPAADPLDPIAALAPPQAVAWLVPGRVQLGLASPPIDAPGGDRPLEVSIFARQGRLVRVALRLPHARFSVWADRADLLAVLTAEHRLSAVVGGDVHATLRAGVVVRRLARRGEATRVRYVGALELEGWLPEARLAEQGPARAHGVRRPSRRHRTLMLTPGAVIRAEPRWPGAQLATVANGYFVELVRAIDPAWSEVAYEDGDISVHGFVSKQAPPARVHRAQGPEVPPPTVTTNAKVASGTCLHAERGGEPIGYVVGDRDVALDDDGGGWWTLALDTPWGPITFAARGLARDALVACAPTGSVPLPALAP